MQNMTDGEKLNFLVMLVSELKTNHQQLESKIMWKVDNRFEGMARKVDEKINKVKLEMNVS